MTFSAVRAAVLLALFLACAPVTATILVRASQQRILSSILLTMNTLSQLLEVSRHVYSGEDFSESGSDSAASMQNTVESTPAVQAAQTNNTFLFSSSGSTEGILEMGVQSSPSRTVDERSSNTSMPSVYAGWTSQEASSLSSITTFDVPQTVTLCLFN
jgi:hypothetical protein